MITIRHYEAKDFPMVDSWWKAHKEIGPTPSMLPLDTTFIMEMEGQPASCLTILLTNCKDYSYLENFVSNPELKGPGRVEANKEFIKFFTIFAKAAGYKNILAFAKEEKLKTHYETLGLRKTLTNLDSFILGD